MTGKVRRKFLNGLCKVCIFATVDNIVSGEKKNFIYDEILDWWLTVEYIIFNN